MNLPPRRTSAEANRAVTAGREGGARLSCTFVEGRGADPDRGLLGQLLGQVSITGIERQGAHQAGPLEITERRQFDVAFHTGKTHQPPPRFQAQNDLPADTTD